MQINVFISLHILLKPLRSLPEKFGFSYFFYILLYHNILFHCNGKRYKLHPGVILKKRLLPCDMQVEVSRNKCLRLMLYIFVKSHPNVMFSFISVGFFHFTCSYSKFRWELPLCGRCVFFVVNFVKISMSL